MKFGLYELLALALSVELLAIVARSLVQPYRTTPRLLLLWAIVLLSVLLLIFDVRTNPGGPFISLHANVLPLFGCGTTLYVVVKAHLASSGKRRLALSLLAFASAGIICLVMADVVANSRGPSVRGSLLGW